MNDKVKRLRGNTIEGYMSALRKHIIPRFGECNIESISFDDVQEWVDSIPTYGATTKAFKTFRQVYRWTIRKKQLRIWDITQGIELPKKPVIHKRVLDATEERAMLRTIVGQEWEAVVLLGASLGLRRCEACGVRIEDIDWRSGWVHIQRGLHWVHGKEVEYPTKTKLSDRFLKLPRWALERLREIRGNRRKGRFCNFAPHQIAGRYKRFCKRYNMPFVPMQQLRHSWATIALNAGAAIEDVSVALGHSTVDTCIQNYLQSFRMVVQRASDAYNKSIGLC